jgi:chlorite dismutase
MTSSTKLSRRNMLGGALLSGLAACGTNADAEPPTSETNPRLFSFVGGETGDWLVTKVAAVTGESLAPVKRVNIVNQAVATLPVGAAWLLHGVTSNDRYVTRPEKDLLVAKQVSLGRPQATFAALIPIRKSPKWWALTQDERRAIFEDQSRHNNIGLKYLPNIARRLHHCRDLGTSEPFDFITLFDYAEADVAAFEQLVMELRATEEWKYVEREVDIRLTRQPA